MPVRLWVFTRCCCTKVSSSTPIGDVSGHGVPAGLCMMMIQTLMRGVARTLAFMNAPLSPSRLLGLVNEAAEHNLQQIGRGQYMTVTAGGGALAE